MSNGETPRTDYYENCIFLREARRYASAETARTCQRILSGAKYVSVDLEAIKRFVAGNYEREFNCPSWKEEFIFPESDEEFVEYLGVCLASNFAFTNFDGRHQFPLNILCNGFRAKWRRKNYPNHVYRSFWNVI